ncbi:MAG: threonine synthase [Armatimonadota bacterium]|nr:threonine synthase [Armatimonadota bacterium]MDR7487000.1 threonine synthase [Armatimonadota bacterium]MDR7531729.1 threonine synthase [Armatimonadota bacterium]MDR7534927.1 threonine synthase [Armatimonadota bacterium]
MPTRFSYLLSLECTACGAHQDADRLHGLCPDCGKVLYPRYDLDAVRAAVDRGALASRPPNMWRYHELLPVRDPAHVVTLGEGGTPLLDAPRLARRFGLRRVWMKDEGQNPTGTFKARGLAAAVSRARELGVRAVSMPTAGNAGSALAAYAARAGIEAYIVMPQDTPEVNKAEVLAYGARAYAIDGVITDAGRLLRALTPGRGWFDLSTLREPYRVEGKKTMGYEIAEALGWRLPDVIVYPAGGGTGLVGIWKAVTEMATLGWIGTHRPRMVAVQAAGCAPIVRAWEEGRDHAVSVADPRTLAPGLRVPAAVGDYLMLRVVRESGGAAVAVTDDEILAAMRDLAATEGVLAAPEAAATAAALPHLRIRGVLRPEDEVVLLLTGSGMKYTDLLDRTLPALEAAAGLPRTSQGA